MWALLSNTYSRVHFDNNGPRFLQGDARQFGDPHWRALGFEIGLPALAVPEFVPLSFNPHSLSRLPTKKHIPDPINLLSSFVFVMMSYTSHHVDQSIQLPSAMHKLQIPRQNIGIALYQVPDPTFSPNGKHCAWALIVHDGLYEDHRVLMYQLYWAKRGHSSYVRPVFVSVDRVTDPAWEFIGIAHLGSCSESLDDITNVALSVPLLGHYHTPGSAVAPPTAWALDVLRALWRRGTFAIPCLVDDVYDKVQSVMGAHLQYRKQGERSVRVPVLDISSF
ncbi:hypothetical protein EW146_g5856 [Bondarzewia mesenterica]|uniref:Uncharacterized protein n=1 Tax=Bondarzewia mesenterica TaxID=1095465 RepID=A0A4S4LVY2_9AGAM|nr:hypothetical protein EW146_g5856 [Bondarzewia mesenterica]